MNKDIELALAAVVLAIATLDGVLEAISALAEGRWGAVIWHAGASVGCAFLTRAVWRAA